MRAPLKVHLSFDVEIWCNGWSDLDAKFPASFERYVYGRSKSGDYALPKTLEFLERSGLHAIFFVEPLFAARFGQRHLDLIVDLIRSSGQEVQLHLHPEWTDEIQPRLIENASVKRQHLAYYTQDEQAALIAHGARLLERAGCDKVTAFRAGSFAANRDTYAALARIGIAHDSSVDLSEPISCADLEDRADLRRPFLLDGVSVHPMSVFRDGFGRMRHAQIGACSFAELRQGLEAAYHSGAEEFVILSHNFEMLKPGTSTPDWIVVKRFAKLCEFLASERESFRTGGFVENNVDGMTKNDAIVQVGAWATGVRCYEQARRRL